MRKKIPQGADLYEILLQQHTQIAAPCGGKASCGKCQIRLIDGDLPVTETEKHFLTPSQLAQGIRLACAHRSCEQDVTIEVSEEATGFHIIGVEKSRYEATEGQTGVGLAVDIGTTTLAMVQIDLATGQVLGEWKEMNPQRMYGADVISRIQACQHYGVDRLRELVLQKIRQMVLSTEGDIRCMYICGNSAMTHIFLGIDPKSLSRYPYTCQIEGTQVIHGEQLFATYDEKEQEAEPKTSGRYDFPVVVLPCPWPYVGGDIVAGIYSTHLMQEEDTLLIDLGTNGEMALSHKGTIYTTSTAAGPAFEGGNMACGVGSIPGAICQIQMEEEEIEYRTIGNQPPCGICGSGYMEGISQLRMQGQIDASGYLAHAVEIEGEIRIEPEDVRHFQLAKSAIRTGIQLLCDRAGVSMSQIRKIFISGGFGKSSNLAALAQLKIIPREWIPRTTLLGNTALEGVIGAMMQDSVKEWEQISDRMVYVDLAAEESFQKEYLKHMEF